ncbi:MAG TPA: cupin domain-containing protein [Blastocatellia bacterium]|jgi:mannose-6-phosphate isomerase-like protein (cupin superfamily)|nr:cupin domain-containing protein [Blastocatellia bacterium]
MKIMNRDNSRVLDTRHGSQIRPLIDRTTSDVTQCSLAEEVLPPGCSVTPHHHDRLEEVYYIISGRGVMSVGDERSEVGPGDAIYIPRGTRHTLANTGSEPVKLLLVCGPAFYFEDEILEGDAER